MKNLKDRIAERIKWVEGDINRLRVTNPPPGRYDIYVGNKFADGVIRARVSELDFLNKELSKVQNILQLCEEMNESLEKSLNKIERLLSYTEMPPEDRGQYKNHIKSVLIKYNELFK